MCEKGAISSVLCLYIISIEINTESSYYIGIMVNKGFGIINFWMQTYSKNSRLTGH